MVMMRPRHVRRHQLTAPVNGFQIYLLHPPPLFEFVAEDVPGTPHRGIIYQRVDSARLRGYLLDTTSVCLLVRDVEDVRGSVAAGAPDFCANFLHITFPIQCSDDGALPREFSRNRRPDALRRARHHADAILKLHASFLAAIRRCHQTDDTSNR